MHVFDLLIMNVSWNHDGQCTYVCIKLYISTTLYILRVLFKFCLLASFKVIKYCSVVNK